MIWKWSLTKTMRQLHAAFVPSSRPLCFNSLPFSRACKQLQNSSHFSTPLEEFLCSRFLLLIPLDEPLETLGPATLLTQAKREPQPPAPPPPCHACYFPVPPPQLSPLSFRAGMVANSVHSVCDPGCLTPCRYRHEGYNCVERSSTLSGSWCHRGGARGSKEDIKGSHVQVQLQACERHVGRDNSKLFRSVAEAVNLSPPLGKVFEREN